MYMTITLYLCMYIWGLYLSVCILALCLQMSMYVVLIIRSCAYRKRKKQSRKKKKAIELNWIKLSSYGHDM